MAKEGSVVLMFFFFSLICAMQVRQRIIRKRIHVRVEHVRKSKCRDAYLAQVAANEAQKQAFKAGNGENHVCVSGGARIDVHATLLGSCVGSLCPCVRS